MPGSTLKGAAAVLPELVVSDFAGTAMKEEGSVLVAYRLALTEFDIPFTEDDLAARRGASKRAVFEELAARARPGEQTSAVAEKALAAFEACARAGSLYRAASPAATTTPCSAADTGGWLPCSPYCPREARAVGLNAAVLGGSGAGSVAAGAGAAAGGSALAGLGLKGAVAGVAALTAAGAVAIDAGPLGSGAAAPKLDGRAAKVASAAEAAKAMSAGAAVKSVASARRREPDEDGCDRTPDPGRRPNDDVDRGRIASGLSLRAGQRGGVGPSR